MAKTFFTADMHINHANVIKYCTQAENLPLWKSCPEW